MPAASFSPDRAQPDSVAVFGVPWDKTSSFRRGAAEGPRRIRAAIEGGSSNLCAESGVDLAATSRFVDLGDLTFNDAETARAFEEIEAAAGQLLARGARPLALGGDHAITYPIVRAFAAKHPDLTILHLDAHPDLYDEFEGDRLSNACPFARIMEEGAARRLMQVGIRTMSPHQREQAERFGVDVMEMRRWAEASELVFEAPLYLSIDIDVLDPAFAPGVSHHEPGGATVRQVVELIQDLNVAPVGADIVELNPGRDHEDRTAMVGVKLMKETAARMLAG